jgi:hypothetical protein
MDWVKYEVISYLDKFLFKHKVHLLYAYIVYDICCKILLGIFMQLNYTDTCLLYFKPTRHCKKDGLNKFYEIPAMLGYEKTTDQNIWLYLSCFKDHGGAQIGDRLLTPLSGQSPSNFGWPVLPPDENAWNLNLHQNISHYTLISSL